MKRIAVVMMVLAMVTVVGCRPKKRPTHQAPNAPSPVMDNIDERMSELQKRSAALRSAVKQLPGHTSADDRKLVADAFERASAALELLAGPSPTGAFRQELRIMDNTRQQLRSGRVDIPADPTIDSGVRALQNALLSVRERFFQDDEQVHKQLDEVANRVSDLDSVRGPLHSLAVARAFNSIANVIENKANELQGREKAAATAPAR